MSSAIVQSCAVYGLATVISMFVALLIKGLYYCMRLPRLFKRATASESAAKTAKVN